jgi:hypothetical protein
MNAARGLTGREKVVESARRCVISRKPCETVQRGAIHVRRSWQRRRLSNRRCACPMRRQRSKRGDLHPSRAGADVHVPKEASPAPARGRPAPSLVPRLRRCQLFAWGSPSSVCPTSGRCSADGERQSKQGGGGRKTEGKSRELIARQALAQTLSRMPDAIAHPRTGVRLWLPIRRDDVVSSACHCPSVRESHDQATSAARSSSQPPSSRATTRESCSMTKKQGRTTRRRPRPIVVDRLVPAADTGLNLSQSIAASTILFQDNSCSSRETEHANA